jgi:hypothetical protein
MSFSNVTNMLSLFFVHKTLMRRFGFLFLFPCFRSSKAIRILKKPSCFGVNVCTLNASWHPKNLANSLTTSKSPFWINSSRELFEVFLGKARSFFSHSLIRAHHPHFNPPPPQPVRPNCLPRQKIHSLQ